MRNSSKLPLLCPAGTHGAICLVLWHATSTVAARTSSFPPNWWQLSGSCIPLPGAIPKTVRMAPQYLHAVRESCNLLQRQGRLTTQRPSSCSSRLLLTLPQVLGQCEDPATQNTTLCELVGEFFETSTFQNASSVGHTADPTLDLLPLFVNPDTDIQNWQDYLTAGAMGMVSEAQEPLQMDVCPRWSWSLPVPL